MSESVECPLRPGDAAAALIVTGDGRYLLQHRDNRSEIFFPGFWGNFGGAIELNEAPIEALRREIREEIGLEVGDCYYFCRIVLDFQFAKIGEVVRHFFVVPITDAEVAAMRLTEGQDMRLISGEAILSMEKVVPYDSIVIWQHLMRDRFTGAYVQSPLT